VECDSPLQRQERRLLRDFGAISHLDTSTSGQSAVPKDFKVEKINTGFISGKLPPPDREHYGPRRDGAIVHYHERGHLPGSITCRRAAAQLAFAREIPSIVR
jgi:hypothetical protein